MPRLSIVIPFVGSPKRLEATLVSVLENRPEDCEVIVVCGRRYADPYDLADEVRFVEARGADPAACINRGIEASLAAVVHVLTAGAEVEPGWTEAALRHFDDGRVAAVAPLVLDAANPQQVLAAGLAFDRGGGALPLGRDAGSQALTSPRQVLCPDPAAALLRRSIVRKAGGLATDLAMPATLIDLGLLLRHVGLRTVVEPQCRVRIGQAHRLTAGAYGQGRDFERLFWQWAPRRGPLGTLALHGASVAADCMGRLPLPGAAACLLGRLVGYAFPRHMEPQNQRLRALQRGRRSTGHVPRPHYLRRADRAPAPGSATAGVRRARAGAGRSGLRGGLRGGLG